MPSSHKQNQQTGGKDRVHSGVGIQEEQRIGVEYKTHSDAQISARYHHPGFEIQSTDKVECQTLDLLTEVSSKSLTLSSNMRLTE